MNHTLIHRGNVLRAILLCFVVALLGTTLVSEGEAKPTSATIKQRVKAQGKLCETGGGTLSVSNEYKTNGPFKTLVKSTTTCNGGTSDGWTCVNTRNSYTCTQAMIKPTVPPLPPITAAQPFASPQTFESFGIVASPVPPTEDELSAYLLPD